MYLNECIFAWFECSVSHDDSFSTPRQFEFPLQQSRCGYFLGAASASSTTIQGTFWMLMKEIKKLLALFFFQPCTLGRNSIKIYMPLCSGRLLPHFATVSMSKSTVWWEIALTDSIRYLKRGKREKIFFLFFLIKCNYSAGNQCHNSRSQVLQIPGTLQHL